MGMRQNYTVLVYVVFALMASGCEQCTQDPFPPTYIDSTTSPYHLAWSTTNTDLERVTWLNKTTTEAGDGVVDGPYWEWIFFGYAWVMHVSMDIPLAAGENIIVVFEYDRGSSCGFHDDYVITYYP